MIPIQACMFFVADAPGLPCTFSISYMHVYMAAHVTCMDAYIIHTDIQRHRHTNIQTYRHSQTWQNHSVLEIWHTFESILLICVSSYKPTWVAITHLNWLLLDDLRSPMTIAGY